ncbi:MAG: tannase/feruloyl esterase family alpha/beta hydrolase [Vulcanimicrobiaceae bacterium]
MPDMRYSFGPTIAKAPGVDPAGDAKALIAPSYVSPATAPIPGDVTTGSYAANERFVLRVPTAWNGKLVIAGTPATRSEFANDAIWSDLALARGYAFASSNKGIAYNVVVEPAASSLAPTSAYPIPFDLLGLERAGQTIRFGLLAQAPTSIADWNADFAALASTMKTQIRLQTGRTPSRTYAVGLSNGGAQVRSLLEQHPELVDGGVDWAGVYWSPDFSFLDYMPKFDAAMPAYVASGYTDAAARAAIVAAGYPTDLTQADPAHPSLWSEYYSNQPAFYTDLTVFVYALYLDPQVTSSFAGSTPCTPNAVNPTFLPGTCTATGIGQPASRAAYVPSSAARAKIATFAHSGRIGKPLVSVAGSADMFVTPQNNALTYLRAVNASGAASLYHQYIVAGGTHVDGFAGFGYGLQPQAPFAWRAFDELVDIVENNASVPGAGTSVPVATPSEIAVP